MEKVIGLLMLLAMAAPVLAAQVVAARSRATQNDAEKLAETEVRRLNAQEGQAFLKKDSKALDRLWSNDLMVTNPLNKLVTKQQVLGMVESGFLVITSFDRQIEYVHVYGDTVIVAGSETALWGGRMPNAGKTEHLRFLPPYG